MGCVRWWVPDDASREELRPRLAAALEELASGRVANQKAGRRKELYVLWPGTPGEVLLKVNRYRGGSAPWRRLQASKARRELALALRAAESGVPTPVPLAAGEERHRGLLERCFLVVPALRPSSDLAARMATDPPRGAERRRLARAFGRLVSALARAGLEQDDLAPNNVLLAGDGEARLFAIDFERARRVRRFGRRRLVRMLVKLERRVGFATRADRMRFLFGLVEGDRAAARRLWRAVEAELPARFRKDVRHLARALADGGRRFRVVGGAKAAGRAGLLANAVDEETESALAASSGGALSGIGGSGRPLALCAASRAFWALPLGVEVRVAAKAHLPALLALHTRGLAPRPLGVLPSAGGSILIFHRSVTPGSPGPRGAGVGPDPPPGALEALGRRLRALGGRLPPPEVCVPVEDGTGRPRLGVLDPAAAGLL